MNFKGSQLFGASARIRGRWWFRKVDSGFRDLLSIIFIYAITQGRTIHYTLVPEHEIWSIFSQIVSAVAYIHAKRIIHRDLKPPNVLLTMDCRVKLTDFGLSRVQDTRSRAQTVCGTPYYMSPERILEAPYSTKSDVWSLGCILYEVCILFFRISHWWV